MASDCGEETNAGSEDRSTDGYRHVPVMLEEVVAWLEPERGGIYLDGTVGGGGHAEAILMAGDGCRLVGVDRDPEAVEAARRRLDRFGPRARVIRGNFRDAPALLEELPEIESELERDDGLAGALLDLGVSSHQLETTARGFSFRPSTPLKMRMGGTTGVERPAADILNEAPEEELGRIFREYGEERRWRRLAAEVVRRRRRRAFSTSDDLVEVLERVHGPGLLPRDKARVFQALRIAVNRELEALEDGLPAIRDLLAPGGRLVVISYHSLEDRVVKRAFREWSLDCVCPPRLPVCRCRGEALGRPLTKGPVEPTDEEVERNPRARSARLRAWCRA